MAMNNAEAKPMAEEEIVYALAASPDFAADGICFAARSSGLYRSDDGGITWRNAYASLDLKEPLTTMAVAVSPDFRSDRRVFGGVMGGVMCSSDGGEHWSASLFRTPPPLISALVISPDFASDGTLFAGTMEDGVFRSADRGGHWAAWNFGLLDLSILCLAISPGFAGDETLFAGTDSGIFRSTNGGRAWRETDFPGELAPVLSLALSPDYPSSGIIFAGTESNGLYRSNDRGKTWVRLGEGIIEDSVNCVLLSPEFPTRPEILAVLSSALLFSPDGGETWRVWKEGMSIDQGITTALAPCGLGPSAPLLIGLVGGQVLRL